MWESFWSYYQLHSADFARYILTFCSPFYWHFVILTYLKQTIRVGNNMVNRSLTTNKDDIKQVLIANLLWHFFWIFGLAFRSSIWKNTLFQNIISHVRRSKRLNGAFGGVWQVLRLKYYNIRIRFPVTVEKI